MGLFDGRPRRRHRDATRRAAHRGPDRRAVLAVSRGRALGSYALAEHCAVANLRRAALAERDPQEPDTLDAHPLVREHFGEQLQRKYPAAWREAHGRLYEHDKSVAKEFPDTIEEMAPLYAAVATAAGPAGTRRR